MRRMLLLSTTLCLLFCRGALADGQTRVSLTAENGEIREVITKLATQAKVKVNLRPELRGRVSATITAMPFERALSTVAGSLGFGWRLERGVYHVGRFSPTAATGGAPVTQVVTLRDAGAAALARAFGWFDLAALDTAPPLADFRHLLPPGLSGPPRPVAPNQLEITGSPAAVADFQHLVRSLQSGEQVKLSVDLVLAKLAPAAVRSLPVYWAQGPMNFGRTDEVREALYSSGEFQPLLERVAAGQLEGATLIDRQHLDLTELEAATVAFKDGTTAKLAVRVEPGLTLRLWLQGTAKVGEGTVTLAADGAKLPPAEGMVLVSRPKLGEEGPEPLLLLVMPRVEVAAVR